MLPTFLVIGAAKAGTTTMCDLLGAHPDVFVTRPKEPHYFSRITEYEAGREWYESLFGGAKGHQARGEGSTSYSHPSRLHFVAPRLRTELPDCRLLYMVRHPVRRLESDWRMRTLERRLTLPIGKAVDRNATLLTFGLYWRHLSVYRELFPDEQILVVFLEDLSADPGREMARAYRHIRVDPTFVPPALARPRNSAQERARSEALTRIARRFPGSRQVARRLPRSIVESGKRLAARTVYQPDVDWAPHELAGVIALLHDDSRQLLEYCGKDPDFWDLHVPQP